MKKIKIWHSIILLVAVALIIGVAPTSGTAQRIAGPKIEWGKDIKIESAVNLTSHRLINKPVETGEFANMSNKVLQKITAKGVKIHEDSIGWSGDNLAWINKDDPSSLILQDAINGNLSFSNRMTEFVTMENPRLPSEGSAQELALGFLKELNLLPGDFEKNGELREVRGLFSQDFVDGEAGERVQRLITLHFGRTLNGFQVQGPGSKLVLDIGHKGEVVNFTKKWNPVMRKLEGNPQPLRTEFRILDPGSLQVKPTEQSTPWVPSIKLDPSFREMTKLTPYFSADEIKGIINRTMPTIWTTVDKILINEVKLVYFDRSGNFIQPAYMVLMTIHTGEESFEYIRHFAALRNAPEPIYPVSFTEMPKVMDSKQKPAEFKEAFE